MQKKALITFFILLMISSLAFADAEIICTSGNSSSWASADPINQRIAQLKEQGKQVTASAPVIAINRNNDRLCVSLNY